MKFMQIREKHIYYKIVENNNLLSKLTWIFGR